MTIHESKKEDLIPVSESFARAVTSIYEGLIHLREISDELAEAEIHDLFKNTKGYLFYSDIESKLKIDIEQVIRVCEKLIIEGQIAVDEVDF